MRTCEPPRRPAPLHAVLLIAFSVTLVAVVTSRLGAALATAVLAGPRAARRLRVRVAEAGFVAAAVQRWLVTPAALGGPAAGRVCFDAVTFDTLGLACGARGARRTMAGTLRLIPVAPCATLDGCAALVGAERPDAGGLLVVGTCETPGEAVAVLVLGPLVQVRLPDVPWAWIRALTTPTTDPLLPVLAVPVAVAKAARVPARYVPQRERRMPSWRSPKPTARRRDRVPERAA